jgi:hypothetical protein
MIPIDLHSVNPAGLAGTLLPTLEPAPVYRIEWCGRVKVYVPVKPRESK